MRNCLVRMIIPSTLIPLSREKLQKAKTLQTTFVLQPRSKEFSDHLYALQFVENNDILDRLRPSQQDYTSRSHLHQMPNQERIVRILYPQMGKDLILYT